MSTVAGGDIIDAADNNDLETRVGVLETSNSGEVLTAGTTTSTTYTSVLTGPSSVTVSFVAPTSGTVVILMTGKLHHSTTDYAYMSWRLEDSGGTVIASSDSNAVQHYGTTYQVYTTHQHVTGLTPGASYDAIVTHKVASGTGTFDDRRLTVIPA